MSDKREVRLIDAISRRAVLEMLTEEFDYAKEAATRENDDSDCANYIGKMSCAYRAMRKVMELPNLDIVPAEQNKWISVKDRLPEDYKPVIVFRDDMHDAGISWIIAGRWAVPEGVNVTHWMPLPEPPED